MGDVVTVGAPPLTFIDQRRGAGEWQRGPRLEMPGPEEIIFHGGTMVESTAIVRFTSAILETRTHSVMPVARLCDSKTKIASQFSGNNVHLTNLIIRWAGGGKKIVAVAVAVTPTWPTPRTLPRCAHPRAQRSAAHCMVQDANKG